MELNIKLNKKAAKEWKKEEVCIQFYKYAGRARSNMMFNGSKKGILVAISSMLNSLYKYKAIEDKDLDWLIDTVIPHIKEEKENESK